MIQAFTYDIAEFSFAGRTLNTNYIKYIVIECLYESRTMATMYLSLHIPAELYQDIMDAEKTENGYINLTIRAKNVYSDTSLSNDYISGRYVYVLPTSNPDYSVNLSSEEDKSYKSLTIGLLDKDYLDKMKTSLCGTYYNIDIQDLLRLALKDMRNVIVQPPTVKNLKKFTKVVIPPMNNMNKLVAYLYNLKPFYNTAYTFFADFSNLYLTAHDAETTAAIGAINRIVFHVTSVTNDAAYIEGVIPSSGSVEGETYHVYLNPADISVSPNKSLDFISNQIMEIQENGTVAEPIKLDYGLIGAESSENSKVAIRRGSNASIVANIYNSNTVTIEFKKSHINGAIIGPDKAISVSFELSDDKDDFNNKYSGDYYMIYKREIVSNNAGTFAVSCAVGLKKIGNLVSVADTSSSNTSSGGDSSSLGYSSGEGKSGSRSYNQGSSSARVQTSSKISQTTQAKLSRVSGTRLGIVSTPYREASNPYNLKSSIYSGPKSVDTSSSGAINLFEPHINESKL